MILNVAGPGHDTPVAWDDLQSTQQFGLVDAMFWALLAQACRKSLDAPGEDGRRRGPTSRHTFERSAYTRASLSTIGRALSIVAAGALVAAAIQWRPWLPATRSRPKAIDCAAAADDMQKRPL